MSLVKNFEELSLSESLLLYRDLRDRLSAGLSAIGETAEGIRFSEEDFIALDVSGRMKVAEGLERILELLSSSVTILGKHQGHFYLRAGLKKFGWKVDPSVFESISENDVVEVWGRDYSLKVANLHFLKVCSYSFEQVLSAEFWRLFQRDEALTGILVDIAENFFRGNTQIVHSPLPDHTVEEISSFEKRRFWVRSKIMAPVFDNTRRAAGSLLVFNVSVE